MTMRKRALPQGWYPARADECAREIESFLEGFTPPHGIWRGGVVPHAGWYFSGKAAARVIGSIAGNFHPDRIVIYGGHLQAGSQPVAYTEEWWETPLGPHPMDAQVASNLVSQGTAVAASRMFSDNTVEIQLPLVKHFFPNVPVVAIHAPASTAAVELGKTLAELLGKQGLTAAYIGSADLTHYGPNYGFSPKGTGPAAVQWVKEENDRTLIERAVVMDSETLIREARSMHNTCSVGPIASVIASMSTLGVTQGRLLEYYTSYDIMPDSSFVGYAAILY
jgi:MEMO1 family protein